MKDYKAEGERAIAQAKEIAIVTEDDYMVANSMGKVFSDMVKEVKAYFKPLKADAKKVHQNWIDAEKDSLKGPEEAKNILKVVMLKYEAKQEAIRVEKEKVLRLQMEQERLAAEAKAEEDGMEIEPPEMTAEDITVQQTYTKQGQTRTIYELEVMVLKDFLMWIVEESTEPDKYIAIRNTDTINALKAGVKIKGIRLKEKKIKVF